MNRNDARIRVQIWISERYRWANSIPQVLPDDTAEYDFGFVFRFRRPDRPFPRALEEFTGGEIPPAMIDRQTGDIAWWRGTVESSKSQIPPEKESQIMEHIRESYARALPDLFRGPSEVPR
jgi:hypothetical protein